MTGQTGSGGSGKDGDDMEARLRVLAAGIGNLATKADIAELRGKIESSAADVRGDIKGWMLATVLVIVGTMAALTFGLFSSLKPQSPQVVQPAASAPPVIINIPPQAGTVPEARVK